MQRSIRGMPTALSDRPEAWVLTALQVVNEASSKNLGDGFRVPALIRFIGSEEGYLSNAQGGPRMFVNMEDHVSRQTGQPNQPFLVSSLTFLKGRP